MIDVLAWVLAALAFESRLARAVLTFLCLVGWLTYGLHRLFEWWLSA